MGIKSLSLRKINIGIICAILIIVLNILNGLYKLFEVELIDSTEISGLINIAAFYFFYLSIWLIVKEILVNGYEQHQVQSNLTWLIRLIGAIGVLTFINLITKTNAISVLIVLFGLPGLVIFLIFMNKVMKIKKEEVKVINHLQNYVISLIIMFLILVVIEFISAYGKLEASSGRIDLDYVKNFINAIPIVFMLLFFTDERREIIKIQNDNA